MASEAFQKLHEEIEATKALSMGWDGYPNTQPPSYGARELAHECLKHLEDIGLLPEHVGPSVESGMGIQFSDGNPDLKKQQFAYIEISNTLIGCIVLDGTKRTAWEFDACHKLQRDFAMDMAHAHMKG